MTVIQAHAPGPHAAYRPAARVMRKTTGEEVSELNLAEEIETAHAELLEQLSKEEEMEESARHEKAVHLEWELAEKARYIDYKQLRLATVTERKGKMEAEVGDILRSQVLIEDQLQKRLAEVAAGEKEPPPGPVWLSFVDGTIFQIIAVMVIVLNSIVMVVEWIFGNADDFFVVDTAFLIFYTIEIILKGGLYQRKLLFSNNISVVSWNWLDLIVVVSGLLDFMVSQLMGPAARGMSIGGVPLWRIARMLRFLRMARLLRVLKIVRVLVFADVSWAEGERFQMFIMSVIAGGCIVMGLELDYPHFFAWPFLEHLMLAIFFFELFCKLKLYGLKFFYGEQLAWNMLDFVIVASGVLDMWIMPLVAQFGGSGGSSNLLKHLKMLRMMRLIRILRLMKLIKQIPPLFSLVTGMVNAMPAMGWVLMLLICLLFASSLVCVKLLRDGIAYGEVGAPDDVISEFESMPESIFALFQVINGDDSPLIGVFRSLPMSKIIYVVFMVVCNWAVLAVMTSIFSDNIVAVTAEMKEEARIEEMNQHAGRKRFLFTQILNDLDSSGDGMVNREEFCEVFRDETQMNLIADTACMEPGEILRVFDLIPGSDDVGVDAEALLDALEREGKDMSMRAFLKVEQHMFTLEDMSTEMWEFFRDWREEDLGERLVQTAHQAPKLHIQNFSDWEQRFEVQQASPQKGVAAQYKEVERSRRSDTEEAEAEAMAWEQRYLAAKAGQTPRETESRPTTSASVSEWEQAGSDEVDARRAEMQPANGGSDDYGHEMDNYDTLTLVELVGGDALKKEGSPSKLEISVSTNGVGYLHVRPRSSIRRSSSSIVHADGSMEVTTRVFVHKRHVVTCFHGHQLRRVGEPDPRWRCTRGDSAECRIIGRSVEGSTLHDSFHCLDCNVAVCEPCYSESLQSLKQVGEVAVSDGVVEHVSFGPGEQNGGASPNGSDKWDGERVQMQLTKCRSALRCGKGHRLLGVPWVCKGIPRADGDGCLGMDIVSGRVRFVCAQCDYSLCPKCYAFMQERLHPDDKDDKRSKIAEGMADRGVTLRQLIVFYGECLDRGWCSKRMSTRHIFDWTILPMLSSGETTFIQNSYLMNFGGLCRATVYVSHAWDVSFLSTLLNLVCESTGWTVDRIAKMCLDPFGEFDAKAALFNLSAQQLESSFWLDVFAFSPASGGDEFGPTKPWSQELFDTIRNPRPRWPKKVKKSHSVRITNAGDKGSSDGSPIARQNSQYSPVDHAFRAGAAEDADDVPNHLVKSMVVCLDPELKALRRAWVRLEMFEASRHVAVRFRAACGINADLLSHLSSGEPLLVPLRQCEAGRPADVPGLLRSVGVMEGGEQAFDTFIECFVELFFGQFARVPLPSLNLDRTQSWLLGIIHLDMDFHFLSKGLTDIQSLVPSSECFMSLNKLHSLSANFQDCDRLSCIQTLVEGLGCLHELRVLHLNFTRCVQLVDVSMLGEGLGHLHDQLHRLSLDFTGCTKLEGIASVVEGIAQLDHLDELTLVLYNCNADKVVQELAKSLGQISQLKKLKLRMEYCAGVRSVMPLQVLATSPVLEVVEISFGGSEGIPHGDVERLADSLREGACEDVQVFGQEWLVH